MSLLEQVALAGLSFARALRESRQAAAWAPWLLLLGAGLVSLVALAWCAHPLFSWFMAPLLRASVGEEALRYPGLYRQLATIAAGLGTWLDGLVAPVAFGGSVLGFAALYRGDRPGAWEFGGTMFRLAPVFILAALPVALAQWGLRAALVALPGIRLASVTRALAPHAADLVVLLVRAACFYAVVHAALVRRGPIAAVASIPGSLRDGFVPALLAVTALGIPVAVIDAVASGPFAAFAARVPESALLLAGARSTVAALMGVLASGMATLVWLGALDPREAG